MTKSVIPVLAAIGTLFLIAALAQSPHPTTQQLTVYDADGKKVGDVTGAQIVWGQFLPQVSFKVEDVPFLLLVFRDGFAQNDEVVWESTDCSGTPFVLRELWYGGQPLPSPMPIVAVGLPGNTVYVEDGPARAITAGSYSTQPEPGLELPFGPSQCEKIMRPLSGFQTIPARPLINMDTKFKPPFKVQ